MSRAIQVQDLNNGDFKVVRGGEVYRRDRHYRVAPGEVKSGETVSAAEVCEWMELGVLVEEAR